MAELLGGLESPELHVSTASPVCLRVGVADIGEAGHYTDPLRHQPERQILGQDQLAPDGQEEQPGEDAGVPESL